MINKLKNVISKAKFVTLTLADQGDHVQITATVRPKDGSDQVKPIQINADWQIADVLLVEALNTPPKPGKTKVWTAPEENSADSLFASAGEADHE
ncbi:MAG: hypothetical protein IJU70_11960 [Lentisphaeria bacterium]|nr:hypothetical protein [Lentisphaeria bacterium]